MKVTICIGSSCHLKGSRQIIDRLQHLVAEKNLKDEIELCGAFCMKNCVNGVSVKIGEKIYSLTPDTVDSFFEAEVISRVN